MKCNTPLLNLCSTFIFVLFLHSAMAQPAALGVFTNNADVGATKTAGKTSYDPDKQSYTISGSGQNIWGQKDEFQYAYRKMTGDFILRANVAFVGEGVDPHRKIGWMVRHSLEVNSPCVSAALHGDGLVSLQFRENPQSDMDQKAFAMTHADVIQLERRGDTFIMSAAKMGERFFEEQVSGIELGNEVYIGLSVCAHNPDVVETATFKNVRVIVPPKPDYVPYRDYIGSHIELMDVATGDRKIVFSADNSWQAPNWMVDDNVFTVNSDGLLYDFDLRTGKPTKLETGAAVRNNNDHVLSFDGKQMGISSTPPEDGHSIIFTMPRKGGNPKRLTPNGPSYLHGWSPNAKELVYTAVRDKTWNIFKIPASGGQEVQLTKTPGLDDGPEYTPDGKYIYFNSNRTGISQIWRMKPDGSNPEQVTFDELNDWFPHISPDGKWIVFISFPRTVDSGQHPFYKHCYIRLMPITGGEPKIIGYIYGGQGSMNVPNWSPDGKRIAFVSNSAFLNY
ncbi:MAG: TolB family protein [Imperialibacter sp.]|uniref:TolB family protein n=1 Tax=Imperialibacter sp. TaxID=2038411 RepID=UPI003A895157